MERLVVFLAFAAAMVGCSINKNVSESTDMGTQKVIWVNKYKVACEGVAPMRCLQVQEGESVNPKNWQTFYGTIEGFEFKPGRVYKLLIEETQLDPSQVPADGSAVKSTLVEVMEMGELDDLNDDWVVTELLGVSDSALRASPPSIKISGNKISGTDGCNRIMGSLEESDVFSFKVGPMMGTKMYCRDRMVVADAFGQQMAASRYYTLDGQVLALQDEKGMRVMQLRRR